MSPADIWALFPIHLNKIAASILGGSSILVFLDTLACLILTCKNKYKALKRAQIVLLTMQILSGMLITTFLGLLAAQDFVGFQKIGNHFKNAVSSISFLVKFFVNFWLAFSAFLFLHERRNIPIVKGTWKRPMTAFDVVSNVVLIFMLFASPTANILSIFFTWMLQDFMEHMLSIYSDLLFLFALLAYLITLKKDGTNFLSREVPAFLQGMAKIRFFIVLMRVITSLTGVVSYWVPMTDERHILARGIIQAIYFGLIMVEIFTVNVFISASKALKTKR
ncbi:hypothetical protein L596_000738 [Steinernema carpocapsae]|uniref:Uncharacterized protein n=1 Tax=Steinernema carpocapsae TaxID=34508 RepID=A0A4U8UJ03_STECR|nr:hypothetical protein L596_000738 [Steinernema carpocapsae]